MRRQIVQYLPENTLYHDTSVNMLLKNAEWSKSHGENNPLGQIFLSFSLWDGFQQKENSWAYSINCFMITFPLW